MRKLLIALIAFGSIGAAFADTPVDFDKTKMECKKTAKVVKLNDGIKKTEVTKSCTLKDKKAGDPADRLRFTDDVSHKEVYCEFDNKGMIKQSTCFIVE
jgi:hypothetical protein